MFQEVQREGDKRVPHGGRAHGRLVYGSVRCSYFNAEFSPTFKTQKGDDYDGPLEDAGFEKLHPACPNLRTQLFVFWLTLFVFSLTK